MDAIVEEGLRSPNMTASFSWTNRQDRRQRLQRFRPGHFPRGRAARYPAHRRRLHGNDEIRARQTDYFLFIRRGRVPHVEGVGPYSGIAGSFPHQGKAAGAERRRFFENTHAARNAIIKQYKELLKTEGVDLVFENEALKSLAKIAFMENETSENIGARRLYTVMEKLLEDIPSMRPNTTANPSRYRRIRQGRL
jgi:hypothetical protein